MILEKGIGKINKIVQYICVFTLLFMMFLGTADVVGRYLFNRPVSGTFEIFEILLPAIVLLGLGYVQASYAHVTLELFVSRLSPFSQVIVNIFTTILMIIFSILILWQGIIKVLLYWRMGRMISNIHVPMFIPQILVPLGALCLCLVLILQLFQLFIKLGKR